MSAEEVRIGSAGTPAVVLRDPRPDIEGWASFVVELHGAGMSSTAGVSVHHMNPLPNFRQALAADWRGWSGERTWDSLEGDLRVQASHDGSHVRTIWTVGGIDSYHWIASVEVIIEPGEQLSALAAEVADLLSTQ